MAVSFSGMRLNDLVIHIFYIPVLIVYAILALAHFLPAAVGDKLGSYSRWLAGGGVVIHLGTLVLGALWGEALPGFPEALSAAALGVMMAYVMISGGTTKVLGLFLTPIATVLLGTSLVVPSRQIVAMEGVGVSPWLPIHLGLIFAGLGGFALAFAVGCAYLFVRNRLKKKKLTRLVKFPSLELLDRIQFRATLSGFIFLTLGIGAGGAWAAVSLAKAWTWDPKVFFPLVIWAWYGLALQLRLVRGWRGRWAALFSIVGFCGVVFSLVVFNFIYSGWHAYAP